MTRLQASLEDPALAAVEDRANDRVHHEQVYLLAVDPSRPSRARRLIRSLRVAAREGTELMRRRVDPLRGGPVGRRV